MSSDALATTDRLAGGGEPATPVSWMAYDHAGEMVIVRDVPEGGVNCYRVTGWTTNVRAMLLSDAVLYQDKIVRAVYDDGLVAFAHDWVGDVSLRPPNEWLREPVAKLEECDRVMIGDDRLPGMIA